MDLKIINCNNFFKVKGTLNKDSLDIFKAKIKNVFNRVGTITISMNAVESIDEFGVKALAELRQEAIERNRSLTIIGLCCKNVYNHFETQGAA